MDHRVSKDMISSGMTPSGERTQADLGKTQYGSAPSPNRLMDAYHSMYQNQKEETLEEGDGLYANIHKKRKSGRKMRKEGDKGAPSSQDFANAAKTAREDTDLLAAYQSIYADTFEEGKIPAGLQAYLDKKKGKKKDDDNGDDNGDEKKSKKGKGSKPDFLDLDKDGDKKEPMKKASKEMKEGAGLNEEPVTTAMTVLKGLKTAGNVLNTMRKSKVAQNLLKAKNTVDTVSNVANTVRGSVPPLKDSLSVKKPPTTSTISNKTTYQAASVDLFDIVKGKLLDEGLSEKEVRNIMLELTPEEIIKELEESSLSAGSSGGHYSDGGDGVFRSKEQVASQFNKNFPPAKNGKVDKRTRKAINTSARDFGIQGPTTLKQSVEPEGETI